MDESIYSSFRNMVFNRRSAAQLKATDLWNLIKYSVPETDRLKFEIEWRHYLLDEIDSNEFGEFFKEYVTKHLKPE